VRNPSRGEIGGRAQGSELSLKDAGKRKATNLKQKLGEKGRKTQKVFQVTERKVDAQENRKGSGLRSQPGDLKTIITKHLKMQSKRNEGGVVKPRETGG